MRGLRKPWCADDDATLRTMWLAGDTAVAIGLALGGRGEEGVRKRAKDLGLDRRSNAGLRAVKFLDGLPRSPRRPKPRAHRRPAFDNSPPILFVDRRRSQCAFIADDARGAETMCCGRPVVLGSSWCAGHKAICTIPPEKSKLVKEMGR